MRTFGWTLSLPIGLLLVALVVIGASARSGIQPTTSAKPEPVTNQTVKVEGKIVMVWNNGHNDRIPRIDLSSILAPAVVTRCDLLFTKRDATGTIWVFDIEGCSRDNSGQGYCGCGIERQLVCARQDSLGRNIALQSVVYESCWSDSESANGVERTASGLRVCYDSFHDKVSCVATFDSDFPEKGLTCVTSPLAPAIPPPSPSVPIPHP